MRQPHEQHMSSLLQQVSHLVNQVHNEQLLQEGLTASQARVLTLLHLQNGASQSDIQQDLLIKPSSMTKLIDRLEEKGLVTRQSSENDARVKRICLTEKGTLLEECLSSSKRAIEQTIGRSLSDEQKHQLIYLLTTIKDDFQRT